MGNFADFADPKWIPKLVKGLDKIARHRVHELERLNKRLTESPRALARRYVEPYVQFVNPVDHAGLPSPLLAYRETLQLWVSRFLTTEDVEKDGSHVLFVLGDAGVRACRNSSKQRNPTGCQPHPKRPVTEHHRKSTTQGIDR